MPDESDTLSFRVSPANLSDAIEILRDGGGLTQYPEAYQALVLERSRRELLVPPNEIRLARGVFDALPQSVQQLLDAEQKLDRG
jgi:hypothetical protein